MNEALIDRFIQLISANTGLHIREEDKKTLTKKLWQRIELLRLSRPEDYYLLLETNTEQRDSTAQTLYDAPAYLQALREWRELICLLTTGESYFFRDRGQFTLLKDRILPQIIKSKNQENRTLRIWSAGCSTGEEPYSLAILIKEMITKLDSWNILILGTDINYQTIEKAKEGIYNSWSFRLLEPSLQRHYFHQRQDKWEIDEQIRRMVKFQYGNLLKDNFPDTNSDIHNMDLIVCRNVFVYFEPKAISVVLKKFYHTLLPSGYLMTAHTELYGQNIGNFHLNVLPESVLYQRPENKQLQTFDSVRYDVTMRASAQRVSTQQTTRTANIELEKYPAAPAVVTKLPSLTAFASSNADRTAPKSPKASQLTSLQIEKTLEKETSQDIFRAAEILFQNKAYAEAIVKAKQAIALQSHNFDAYYLLAQAYANLGQHNKAIYYCEQALKIDSLSLLPYYLLAHIAEEKKDLEKAKFYLKTIIYLAPSFISAYLELGFLYQREGNTARAKKMLATAIELLKELPPTAPVEQQGAVTAGELLVYVKKMFWG